MSKILRTVFKSILILIIFGIGYMNVKLYYKPDFQVIDQSYYNEDVYNQLSYLKSKLHDGAGMEMQQMFPEGFMFINSMYGLSWCNLIENLNDTSKVYKEGIQEINWTLKEVESPRGKSIFKKELPLEYGAFYRGWSNYLLGRKLMLQPQIKRDSIEVKLFKDNCEEISEVIKKSNLPYLESYKDQIWPADVLSCIATLKIHDRIFEEKYSKEIKDWIDSVKGKLDTETGLIPHSVYPKNGEILEGARGSSQSLILNFLIEIDEKFSREQFEIYKKIFLTKRFGLPGIREYPKGKDGNGDIDSGPVILDIGGAASIVGQRTMGKHENWTIYEGLRNSIEAFGFSQTIRSKKRYILGKLPMADAFIVWSNSIETTRNQVKVKSNWRIRFQIISIVIILIFGYLIKK